MKIEIINFLKTKKNLKDPVEFIKYKKDFLKILEKLSQLSINELVDNFPIDEEEYIYTIEKIEEYNFEKIIGPNKIFELLCYYNNPIIKLLISKSASILSIEALRYKEKN